MRGGDNVQLKILGLNYDLREVECIEHGTQDIGRVDFINQAIYIKKDLHNDRKKIVLIHEILHAIFEQLGFTEENENEQFINSLAVAIYELLKNNYDVISSL